jgi:hypothetical protein
VGTFGECVLCGASVSSQRKSAHDRWHERLNEVLSLIISANGDREAVRAFNHFVVRGGQLADAIKL